MCSKRPVVYFSLNFMAYTFCVLALLVGCEQWLLDLIRRIIIGSDRQPETKQGIKGKIVSFRSGRDRVRVRDKDHRFEPGRRSEAINFGTC